jgi:hypothetical protein
MKWSSNKGARPWVVCLRVALTLSMVNPLVNKQRIPGASAAADIAPGISMQEVWAEALADA